MRVDLDTREARRRAAARHGAFLLAVCVLAPVIGSRGAGMRGESAPQQSNASGASYVPFQYVPMRGEDTLGVPVVGVRLNDSLHTDFAIDTGANISAISPELEYALGLEKKKPGETAPPRAGGPSIVKLFLVDIGGAARLQTDAKVASDLFSLMPDDRVQGILAGRLFAFYGWPILLNFATQDFYVLKSGNLTPAQVQHLGFAPGSTAVIPLTVVGPLDHELFSLPVHIVGGAGKSIALRCLLDTGSSHSVFYANPTPLKRTPLLHREFAGMGARADADIYPVESITAGASPADSDRTAVRIPAYFVPPAPDEPAGMNVLGMDYLSRFKILIDYPARKLYLERAPVLAGDIYPTEACRVNAERQVADLIVKPSADARWSVERLDLAGGPFTELGLRNRDRLTAIDGQTLDGLTSDAVYRLIRDALESGQRLRFEIVRDGKPTIL